MLVNVGWFACVLGAAYGYPWVGPLVVVVLVGVHVACRPNRRRELALLVAAAAFGYVVDSALVLGGMLSFPEGARLGGPSAVWMVAMWANLATSMHASFAWLIGRPLVAALIGLVGGPLAYLAGMRLGAITFSSDRVVSLGAIAVAWALAMPILAWLGRITREEATA